MKAKIFLTTIAICIFFYSVYAGDFDNEVITMFDKDVVIMPEGLLSAPVNDVFFSKNEIKTILLNHTAKLITVAFPDYNPADSLLESPRFPGVFAKQPALERIYKITLTDSGQRDNLNTELESFDEVFFSEKNCEVEFHFTPNDDEFYRQWGMHEEDTDLDIDAPEAWDLTQGNEYTVIGIIDEGVDQNHIEFQGRISGDHYIDEDHGTLVAGIAAARGNNNHEGIAGVTWNSQIYSKNVSGYDEVDIYNAVIDAVTNGGVDVLNNSWSGPNFSSLIHSVLAFAHDLGVLVVAARGNYDNYVPRYPASYGEDWVLSVGAFNYDGLKSDFSSYGSGLDIMAPGGNMDGPNEENIYSTTFLQGYRYDWGTSLAAPHVSGMVGLLDFFNQLPAFGSNFRNVIINTAIDIYEPGYDDFSGYGRLNARAALDYINRPNSIYTCETDTYEPYLYSVSDMQHWVFRGARVLPDAVYFVKQYEVRENVLLTDCEQIGYQFNETPIIWGIDCLTLGWSNETPNGGIRKCYVVDNSNPFTATLATFVYEVFDFNLDPLGFYPNHYDEVDFGYTVIANETPDQPRQLFVTASSDHHPLIEWIPPSNTINVSAYKVYRMVHGIEDDWVHIGTVPHGEGTHQYLDTEYSTPHPGSIAPWTDYADYTVVSVNSYGDESNMPPFVTIVVVVPEKPEIQITKSHTMDIALPEKFELSSAYPNPFNAQTKIKYALPEDSYVILEVLNLSGQKVTILVNGYQQAGFKEIIWDASGYSSGVYFYRIQAGEFTDTKQMSLLK